MKLHSSMFCAVVFLFTVSSVSAAERWNTTVVDLPAADFPYNADNGGRFPSMQQSLALTKDTFALSHRLFSLGFDEYPRMSVFLSGLNDIFLLTYLPGGNGWLHEEGHRAVMGQYGIESYNEIYRMRLLTEMVSVSHVKDEDLARLKANHPADMVRLHSAGIEMEYMWIDSSRQDFFFSGRSTRFERVGWICSALNSLLYIHTCTTSEADTETDKFNARESDVRDRDFTGLDFTAWVYDLHRPDEPYAVRGTHPLGNGYDRYIKRSDLTWKERRYLKQQFWLSFMNFVSPQFAGFDSFLVDFADGDALLLNFAAMHYLTSFGTSSELHLYAIYGECNISATLRAYRNENLTLPGADVSLRRMRFAELPFLLTGGLSLWLQPKDQMFHTRRSKPGAGAQIETALPFGEHFEVYASLHGKSEGWQAGEVSLGKSADLRAGIRLIF